MNTNFPPVLIPNKDFEYLISIKSSTVFTNALNVFLRTTMALENYPFSSILEGGSYFHHIINYIVSANKTYYCYLNKITE